MQEEAFRIQKDMYIRIKDLELLDLSKSQIYEIMRKQGTPKKQLIIYCPVIYSSKLF